MGHKNGKITAPVSIYDVQQTLGESSTDLGTLCRSPKINKYSLIKPVPYNKIAELTDDERKSTNYGFGTNGIPIYTNTKGLFDALSSGIEPGNMWKNQMPSYYRLTDFCGYVHTSQVTKYWGNFGVSNRTLRFPFSGTLTFFENIYDLSIYDTFQCKIDRYDDLEQEQGPSGLIYIADFYGIEDISSLFHDFNKWHLGVLLVRRNDFSTAYVLSSEDNIGNRTELIGSFFYESGYGIPFGFYNMYPVMTSLPAHGTGTNTFIRIFPSTSNSNDTGSIVLFDGYNIPINLSSKESIRVFLEYKNGRVYIRMSAKYVPIEIYDNTMFIYIQSEYLYNDGYDLSLDEAIYDWEQFGTIHTSGVISNDKVVATYHNVYNTFYSANGESNIQDANTTVEFDVNVGMADELGYEYDDYTSIKFCFYGRIGSKLDHYVF